MKKILLFLLLGTSFFLVGCQENEKFAKSLSTNDTFWIATDIHFIAPSLHDDGKEFQFIKKTAAGKDLDYQVASLSAFVAKAKKERPAAIILTGDLTLNGERQSAKEMAQIFSPLRTNDIPVLAILGNHDIYDGWAKKYQEDKKERIDQVSPADFKQFFPDGYKMAFDTDSVSLSYAVNINKTYDFIFLDTNEYPIQNSRAQPHTGGQVKEATLAWLEETLKTTENNHKIPIVFMHHNLFKHNPLIYKGYVLSNDKIVKKLFAKYHVPIVFSGHIHAQDIMKDPTGQTAIIEVVTSSFAIADHSYGELQLQDNQIIYKRKQVNVQTWAKENKKTGQNLRHHNTYLKNLFIKDGERLAYQQLLEQNVRDEEILAPAAKLVAKVNYNYFTGNDNYSSNQIAAIKESEAYDNLKKYSPFLQQYLDYSLQDDNLSDQKIVVHPLK